jgi:haloalkane dehalogenase
MTDSMQALPRLSVLTAAMAYRESGADDAPAALFLHGNPTSSYSWRNVMPHVGGVARCVAPDLIGFGQSDKPDIDYRFDDHVRYLDAFIAASGIESAYLVAQDWGTALALHLAARRPAFVRGLAFMEFIRPWPTWEDFHETTSGREAFKKFRTPGVGEQLIMEDNAFVERMLTGPDMRALGEDEMAVYRAPFPTPSSRRPLWRLANELPIAGRPADVYETLDEAHRALAASDYPKLLFAADQGALVSPEFAERFVATLHSCELVHLSKGVHYLQESNPDAIGRSIRDWIVRTESGVASNAATAHRAAR